MVRNQSRRHPGANSQLSSRIENSADNVIMVDIAEESPRCEPDLNSGHRPAVLEHEPGVPQATAQEVWDALKEEFYEQIEQLPLSLHRSFALIGEQDKEVEACRAELLPTIRAYVKLRQSLRPRLFRSIEAQDSQQDVHPSPASVPHDPEDEGVIPDSSVPGTELLRREDFPERESPPNDQKPTRVHNGKETVDVIVDDVSLETSPHNNVPPPTVHSMSSEPSTSLLSDLPSHLLSARTQSLRETDASVPKSAPFPPRPKPKTTRELLTRITFLMGEMIRASEEKVGLATAAYDSVDRHVRVIDAVINEHGAAGALGLHEGTPSFGMTGPGTTVDKPVTEDDDDEPQLGIVGPSRTFGDDPGGLKRSTTREGRDKQTYLFSGNPPSRLDGVPLVTNPELPVDPHEPRYCYCHQVSYGEMIACDNQDCSREWFHLGCAGLSAPPRGKVNWYCRDCEEALGRNKRRRLR